MVYIKRIDLRGFKTFGKRVSISLDRGLTVVTGPNGSGKSNILDAVKFALGELSPKELRGGTIGDLIHRGPQAATQRSAYVAVQFENKDRRIPIDSDAVTISREFSRGGEGIYRLNGRRISRKQLTDVLSSGDIQVAGHNIVPQHAITRLAEVTPEERRQIIEDMIGIAVYDTKKAEAQVQLQQADVNLQIASAKIGEVRSRVEALERERNDYLRSLQLRKELTTLKAKVVSQKVRELTALVDQLKQQSQELQRRIDEIRAQKEGLSKHRAEVASARRAFEKDTVDKGSAQLFELEREIGDVNAVIARLRAELTSGESTIKNLERQDKDAQQHLQKIGESVEAIRHELRVLRGRLQGVTKSLQAKQAENQESTQELELMRSSLGMQSVEADRLEQEINRTEHRLARFDAQVKASQTKIDLLASHLKTLETKRAESVRLIESIHKRQSDLGALKAEEDSRLKGAEAKYDEYEQLLKQREQEFSHAAEVSKKARVTLVEFRTQRELATEFAAEESALELIEEMGRSGAIPGIIGRLEDLIEFEAGFEKAVKASASGWLKSLVVKDVDSAIACVESLKRTKVGRVKLIPLTSVSGAGVVKLREEVPGIIGPMVESINCGEGIRPALRFVFGDTLLASTQSAAFLASVKGYRSVALSGDLYELDGAMETGYYREPFDFRSLIPKENAIKDLGSTVESLESLVERSRSDIERIRRELVSLTEERASSRNVLHSIEREFSEIAENLERAQRNVLDTDARVQTLTRAIETERVILAAAVKGRDQIEAQLTTIRKKYGSLRIKAKSAELLEVENKHSGLLRELNEFLQSRIEIESKISTLESSLKIILPSLDQVKLQRRGLEDQAKRSRQENQEAQATLEGEDAKLREQLTKREQLSGSLTSVNAKRSEFEASLKNVESELSKLLDKLEATNSELAEVTASLREKEMRADFHFGELKELGHEQPLEATAEEIDRCEQALPALKHELDSVGAVNQLAVQQYEEVKGNYQQLASRIYDLEKEKLSIVQFMTEVEQKKHDTFMSAFNEVNKTFQEIFAKITETGAGRFVIETPDDPFEGGVDIFLRFPGKTEMAIGSASGGEKSVGTVCFILALHAIHPMPFYLMDEVDAHLDVVNTQRLAELLRQRSRGSQFVLVSLKDVTISRADKVHGVFVQDGVSQVVSLPMVEVKH